MATKSQTYYRRHREKQKAWVRDYYQRHKEECKNRQIKYRIAQGFKQMPEGGYDKKCENCGVPFRTKMSWQRFCCRKCFRKSNYRRLMGIFRDEEGLFPDYVCQFCGHKWPLDFHPVKDECLLKDLECPKCGKKREIKPNEI